MPDRPLYIASEIYRTSTYGPKHPLAIPRVSTCTDLIRAMRWLDPAASIEAPMATAAEIARFHAPDYLQPCSAPRPPSPSPPKTASATASAPTATRSTPKSGAAQRPQPEAPCWPRA